MKSFLLAGLIKNLWFEQCYILSGTICACIEPVVPKQLSFQEKS